MHLFMDKGTRRNGYIETFGLCGAGKSTFLNELTEILAAEGEDLYHIVEKPVVPSAVATFHEAGGILIKVFKYDCMGILKFLFSYKSWWLPLKLGYRSAGLNMRNQERGLFLIDSGLLQPFVSFEIEVNSSEKKFPIGAFLLAISLPSLVIYVRVSAKTAFKRYTNRDSGLRKRNVRGAFIRQFERGFRTCEDIYRICLDMGIPLLVFNAEDRISQTKIKKFAEQILDNPLIKYRQ